MSFFVSDSLKGIISEEDLAAEELGKSTKGSNLLTIHFQRLPFQSFKCELIKMSFDDKIDNIEIRTSHAGLHDVFSFNNKVMNCSIFLNENDYMQRSGEFTLNEIEVNSEDNYVTCKIDIHKRSN